MKHKIKELFLILVISLITMSGMNISPALNSISNAYPGVPIECVQLLISLPSLTMIITSLCAEWIASWISKKKILLASAAACVVAGCSPIWIDGLFYMLLTRAVVGLCMGFMIPLGSAMVFEHFSEKTQRNTVIGWQNCTSSAGNIMAAALAGVLALISFKAVFYVHLIGLVPFLGVLFLVQRDPKKHVKENTADKRNHAALVRPLIPWLLLTFTYMAFLNCFSTNISLLVERSGIGNSTVSGFGISIFTIGSFGGGLIFGKLFGVTKKHTLCIGMLISACGLFAMAIAQSVTAVYISGILSGFGMSMVTPVLINGMVEKVSASAVTFSVALYNVASNLGLSITPYTVNYISSIFSNDSVRERYMMCAIVIGFLGISALLLNIKKRKTIGE